MQQTWFNGGRPFGWFCFLVGLHIASPVLAAEEELAEQLVDEEVTVTAAQPATAASDQTVRDQDFKYFPRRTASDLMRLIPGLHVTQHTGGAKAHQIFLRGFDAEHGQDIAASLDHIPLNEVSHVHGQGYLDLHFLIPEVIEHIHIQKGPYDARLGDFATAGAIEMFSATRRDQLAAIRTGAGQFNSRSVLAQVSTAMERGSVIGAFMWEGSDGYTDPGEMETIRAFSRASLAVFDHWQLDMTYAGYRARSQAADVVPERMIDDGSIGRFESLDKSNRVDVDRHLAGVTLQGPWGSNQVRFTSYYNFKDTRIFSNYTFFTYHEDLGDQLDQSDHRHYGGLEATLRRIDPLGGTLGLLSEWGVGYRLDRIDQHQTNTHLRKPVDQLNRYRIQEHNLGAWAAEKWLINPRWTLVSGLRYDMNLADVAGTQDVVELDIYTNQVVTRQDVPREADALSQAISPKLSAIYQPADDWRLFFNLGRGFVTRPARDQAAQVEFWSYAVNSAEMGTRWNGFDDTVATAFGIWWMHKDRELVFDPEMGGTVFRGQSHRAGLELELRWAPVRWMWLGTDVFLIGAQMQTRSGWQQIPNAPRLMMTNALGLRHPIGLRLSARGRFVGPRQHDLGLESPPTYVLDAVLAWEWKQVELGLEVDNLLNVDWYDSVFAYPVRPAPGAPIEEGLQVTPGTPFFARLYLSVHI